LLFGHARHFFSLSHGTVRSQELDETDAVIARAVIACGYRNSFPFCLPSLDLETHVPMEGD